MGQAVGTFETPRIVTLCFHSVSAEVPDPCVGLDRAVSRLLLGVELKLGFMFPDPAALEQLLSPRLSGQSSAK